jgi:hypothetical protein
MGQTVRQIALILRLFVTPALLSALLMLSAAETSHAINLGLGDGSYTVTLDVTNDPSVPKIVGTMTVTGGNISGWRFVVDANIIPGTNISQGVGTCFLEGQTQEQCAVEFGPNNTHPRFFLAVAAGKRNWFYVPVAGPDGGLGSAKYIGTWQATAVPDK